MQVDQEAMISDRKLLLVSMKSHMCIILCLETGTKTEIEHWFNVAQSFQIHVFP